MGNSIRTQDDYIELWVSSCTPEGTVQAAIASCRASGVPVVVYRSGTVSLSTLTADLLRNNLPTHPTHHESIDH